MKNLDVHDECDDPEYSSTHEESDEDEQAAILFFQLTAKRISKNAYKTTAMKERDVETFLESWGDASATTQQKLRKVIRELADKLKTGRDDLLLQNANKIPLAKPEKDFQQVEADFSGSLKKQKVVLTKQLEDITSKMAVIIDGRQNWLQERKKVKAKLENLNLLEEDGDMTLHLKQIKIKDFDKW